VRIEEGAFLVEGRMSLRQLNREIPCELPLDGPKTISGFIIAYLEGMPTHACCIKTHQLNIEIVEFNDLAIQKVKIYTV
jgi:Mg2+/Co2+ transporter CorB